MGSQQRIRKPRTTVDMNTRTEVMADSRTHREADRLRAEMDEMLDEVDAVLEENAQEFVANYMQRGGQLRASRNTWLQPYGGACRTRSLRARLAR